MNTRNLSLIHFALCLASAANGAPAIEWNQKIDSALKQTGSISIIADELAASADNSIATNQARVRVALESGQLASALILLQRENLQQPDNTAILQQLAHVQAMLGLTDAAQQTLNRALMTADHQPIKNSIALKLATLALDTGRTADGVALLDRLIATDPSVAGQAGMIAYLFGENAAAVRYLSAGDHHDITQQFLAGNAAMHVGNTETARAAFTQAFNLALKLGDRQYAQERLIASARQSGGLDALADEWLADPHLPAQRLLPLATMLRESGRVDDLLKLWKRESNNPAGEDVVSSDRFINEVLGSAQTGGRGDDAVTVCRELLVRDPDNQQWLTATVRTLLSQGKSALADAVLNDRMLGAAEDPVRLLEIGRLARALHRDQVAVDVARKIEEFGGVQRITGQLLEASIWLRAGDLTKVIPLLKSAEAAAPSHPSTLDAVAGALDAARLDDDAIQLLQQRDTSDLSTDHLNLLASLQLNQHRPAEAIPSLERVLHSQASTAVRSQAGQRLIDAATQANCLKELIDRTRARIASGHGDDQDLSLLVSAFLQLKDLPSAVAALEQSHLLERPEKLRRLAVLYLRQKDLIHAQQTLLELVEADPASAVETLERLASVQLARNQTQDATSTIHDIEARIGNDPMSSELMAGVLDRLGRSGDAASQYRRALALTPERTNDWLLWATAQAKAGDAEGARHRLQMLCGEATDDNLFGIAVDGLLNLKAAPLALREVRRQTILRLAERPRAMILYYVLSDLSDELGDPVAVARATEASVAANDETRPQRLRELMDVASQKGMVDTAIACGRTLVALGDEFPPQLYLQLGEQLLVRNQLPDASRAFARAAEDADADMVATRAGLLFEKYGYPLDALNVLLPLADRSHLDADYDFSLAQLEEIVGRTDDACGNYLNAIALTSDQLAADQTPVEQRAAGSVNSYLVIDASRRFETFSQSVAGAIATARSTEQQRQLIGSLQARLDRLVADSAISAPTTSVVGITAALRQAAFALGQPDVADHADAEAIARWPASKPLKTLAVEARVREGFFARALTAAETYHMPQGPLLHAAAQFQNAAPSVATTVPTSISLDQAADLLPALILRGQLDQAREVLHAVEPVVNVPPEITPSYGVNGPTRSPVKVMIQAAGLLQEDKLARQWAVLWLDSIARSAESPVSNTDKTNSTAAYSDYRVGGLYSRLISTTWRVLSPETRSILAKHMCDQISQMPVLIAGPKTILCALQVAVSLDAPIDTGGLVNRLFDSAGDVAAVAPRVFNLLPSGQRPAFISIAMERLPISARLRFLLTAVGQARDPLDAATQTAVIKAANALPSDQVNILSNEWCTNFRQAPVLEALAQAVLRSTSDASNLVAAAVGFSVAGDSAHADSVALRVIDLLAAQPAIGIDVDAGGAGSKSRLPKPLDRVALLRTAVASMSQQSRLRLLQSVPSEVDSSSVWRDLLCSVLLDSLGQRDKALVSLHNAYVPNVADVSIAHAYAARLEADGRMADIAGMLGYRSGSNDGDGPYQRRTLSHALVALFRWREVRATAADFDPGAFIAPDFMTPTAAGDPKGLARAFTEMLQRVRGIDGMLPPVQTSSADGLLQHFDSGLTGPILNNLSNWPGSLDDLLAMIHMPGSSGNAIGSDAPDWLAAAALQTATDHSACRRIVSKLEQSAASQTLTPCERKIIARLAVSADGDVSDGLLRSLWPAAAADSSGVELGLLADALVARHAANADIVRRWADILQGGGPTLPRAAVKANERLSPTPVDNLTDDGVAEWAEHALKEDPESGASVARQLDRMRMTGHIEPLFLRCDLIRARLAADAGDVDDYQRRLHDLLVQWAWAEAMPRSQPSDSLAIVLPDISQCLPIHVAPQQQLACVIAAEQELENLSKQWPGDTDITREIVLLGEWARAHDQQQTAERICQSAANLGGRQGIGEHLLWVSDLRERLGDEIPATQLRLALLNQRCLPAIRIAPLLEQMQSSKLAHQLALEAADYCQEPALQSIGARSQDRPN